MLKISIIIPTYNRPKELRDCIQSILEQSVKPEELIVIDDGNLSEQPFKTECIDAGIRYVYQKKGVPGLTASRNEGIKLADGDIIFFLDDDVVLRPNYIEEIVSCYKNDPEHFVGGVGGAVINGPPMKLTDHIRRMFEVVFLISGIREGKVLPSGFCTELGSTGFHIKKTKEVDFLGGGVCSFRKSIFQEFSFDKENYIGYGLGEDKDFSYQVSKKHKLLFNPNAKLLHFCSPEMRVDEFRYGQMFIMYRHLFFSQHVKKNRWSWIFFYYAIFGYIMNIALSYLFLPKKGKLNRLRGMLTAFKDVLKGRNFIVE